MKVLVTAANGQLGTDLCRAFSYYEVIPLTHKDADITDIKAFRKICEKHKPDVIVNPAAYIDVDGCETNFDKAFLINAFGPRNLAIIAREIDAKLVQISTAYVFGGENRVNNIPYTEFDIPHPVNVYGQSKLAGDNYITHLCHKYFIIRTSGLFGVAGRSGKGDNFVETMLRLGRQREKLTVVNDQFFSPTYSYDLAKKITELTCTEYYGLYHITNKGFCSWFEFTVEIFKQVGLETTIVPVTSSQYPLIAQRPHFSVIDNSQLRILGLDDMRAWKDALEDYLREKGHLTRKR